MGPLPDTLAVFTSAGAVVGGTIGFAFPPGSDRELIENVVSGAQIGAVLGSALGFVWWIARSAAGG